MGLPVRVDKGLVPLVRRDRKTAQRIIDAVREGKSTKMAAAIGGIARRTLYEWIYKGREIRDIREDNPAATLTPYDEDYLWFLINFEQAEIERKAELLRRIDEAGKDPKRWQANAWLLERLHPDEFSLRRTVTVQENSDKEVFTLNMGSARGAVVEADFEIEDGEDG